ncbi:ubiquitin carboxyl-terminal hydrolase 47 [Chelonus insularis]|uniref:ubiquitin carboxyl-terminal hydrolase 47 n=1 Tax=Chelonus insularis TaxID=460826 RepID=UPI0015892A26|nr:ubiquitin carboxyl-terminal hydrolase 47 [Chelonus insularis]XP_034952533.1 ubiquitin carboxyl-terminal hydrolase 47 [Chelonus insularis]
MVVVADEVVGDAAHDLPICNTTKESDGFKPVFVSIDYYNRKRSSFESDYFTSIIIILAGKKILHGSLESDTVFGGKKGLIVGTEVTVRQLIDIVSCCDKYHPPLEAFQLFIQIDKEVKIPLNYKHNQTLENIGIDLTTLDTFHIECVKKDEYSDDMKEPYVENMIQLQLDNSYCVSPTKISMSFFVRETTRVSELFNSISDLHKYLPYEPNSLELSSGYIKMSTSDGHSTMAEMGFNFSKFDVYRLRITKGNLDEIVKIKDPSRARCYLEKENLLLGHSSNSEEENEELEYTFSYKKSTENYEPEVKPDNAYVGLVNQAMTCYLNSLLQALYMTPEFRNALYNWEYVEGSEKDESNSIPYQLQKLFLNLQTSTKNAVETTALTKSFGWDSTEAWQQHDIQELCRVMLDSLEQKFRYTEQADLINRLYEGKMIDYVKCLECKMEKSREDTFLDIPLPVKTFGSNVAYNSVEEALRAFVQPETLEGVNQYFCETCNKKCNAHKGLKFTKFPYLLTLHLKRFDFDYNTFHRIKLNDKVTFPDILNLNSFIKSKDNQQESLLLEDDSTSEIKVDENSTIDNDNVDDGLPCDNGISSSEATNSSSEQNDDDGIDVSHCPSTSSTHSPENEHNQTNNEYCTGPYQYELFSIMIHSGGASGGHYYAYIKDFKTQKWLCFNDQSVTSITRDDIQKTYGGGPSRAYYNGAYSSSTNAYMLMYRQIDPERNTLPMNIEDFPTHLQEVLKKMREQEKKNKKKNTNLHSLKIFFHHPIEKKLAKALILVLIDETLAGITEKAYKQFKLDGVVDLDQCRLVVYSPYNDVITYSLEKFEDGRFSDLLWHFCNSNSEKRITSHSFMLEIKRKDEKFKVYLPSEITTKVFLINVATKKIEDGPINIRVDPFLTVSEYKKVLSEHLSISLWQMQVVVLKSTSEVQLLEHDYDKLDKLGFTSGCKVFVATKIDINNSKSFNESTLKQLVDIFENVVMLNVQLPEVKSEILDELNIPSLENKLKEQQEENNFTVTEAPETYVNGESTIKAEKSHDIVDGIPIRSTEDLSSVSNNGPTESEECQEQSNSEDSSLSDSDKTLVGNASEDDDYCLAYVINKFVDLNSKMWSIDINEEYFFQARSIPDAPNYIQIFVDTRINMQLLKKYLEPFVKVPAEYFSIDRDSDSIYSELKQILKTIKDGEKLVVKLGRVLRDNEFKVRFFRFGLDSTRCLMTKGYVCDWVISTNDTVAEVKAQILTEFEKNHGIKIPYKSCLLRKVKEDEPWIVLHDKQKIKECNIEPYDELIIQENETAEVMSPKKIIIAIRLFQEDGPFQEIIINSPPVIEELREKIAEIANAPIEEIEVKKGAWVIDLCTDYDPTEKWTPATDDVWPIAFEDGVVIMYRFKGDSSNGEKKFSQRSYKRLYINSNHLGTRIRNMGVGRVPTPDNTHRAPTSDHTHRVPASDHRRRERALKIYVDHK